MTVKGPCFIIDIDPRYNNIRDHPIIFKKIRMTHQGQLVSDQEVKDGIDENDKNDDIAMPSLLDKKPPTKAVTLKTHQNKEEYDTLQFCIHPMSSNKNSIIFNKNGFVQLINCNISLAPSNQDMCGIVSKGGVM